MTDMLADTKTYKNWLKALKDKVRQVQLKAATAVNQELLRFYWELGADIVKQQDKSQWGDRLLKRLSRDLMADFPEMKGFSLRNLAYIRQWYLFWTENVGIVQQPVAQITQQPVAQIDRIPWGHNLLIITKCKDREEALYYVQNTIAHGWSRRVLSHQIESGLWERDGRAISNFTKALSPSQSDLATQTLKDPYVFDFLALSKAHNERELEKGLLQHITRFLLELGAGFSYVGRQVPLKVGEREFYIDLLFYHTKLHCYVVVELKTKDFEPEHVGKLNFYIRAVDEQMRQEGDQPTIGLLLCKSRDAVVVEYSLSDIHKPIGISKYQLSQALTEKLKSSLPSVEELEAELDGRGSEE